MLQLKGYHESTVASLEPDANQSIVQGAGGGLRSTECVHMYRITNDECRLALPPLMVTLYTVCSTLHAYCERFRVIKGR
jgi:hypothetical protein